MATKNLPCPKKIGVAKGHCDGELILIDGSNSSTRLKCNICNIVVTLKMSLMQFAQHLKDME